MATRSTLLINDSPRPWHGGVDFAARGPGEQYDPATGKIQPLNAGRPIEVALDAYGATLVRLAEPPLSARRPLTTGALPGLALKPLPSAEPTTPHGEYVAVELRHEPASGPTDEPWFDVRARLTRGKVDCYLFVKFHHDKPLSLEGSDCLVIDTRVPPGQKTRTDFLVILHEDGGGDFVAATGRSLGLPGQERTYLPLSRFNWLAGPTMPTASWTQGVSAM